MTASLTRRLFLTLGALLLLVTGTAAHAADPVFSTWTGKAINGYDPVAYFTEGKPVEGSGDHTAEWNGATWQFASAGNRDAFVADPEKYAPQYGGYCAYAVAQGATAKTEPEAWKIVDGKLYLNYSLDVQKRWEAQQSQYITDADKNWPGVLN